MTAIFIIIALICAMLPARWVVPILPAFWMAQGSVLGANLAILHAGSADLTPVDIVLVSLLLRWAFGIVLKKQLVADKPLYAAITIFLAINFLAALAAGAKFGQTHFLRCLTSEAR